jgi:hypothetical protein
VANVRFVLDEPARDTLLLNDGRGVLTNAPEGWHPAVPDQDTFTVQALDIDRDGDIDIVAPSTVFGRAAGEYRVLLNDGRARFALAAPGAILPAAAGGNGFDVEVADFDADGRSDLFFCNRASDDAALESGGLQRLLLGRAP